MPVRRFLRRNRGFIAFVWLSLGTGLAMALMAAALLKVGLQPVSVQPVVQPTVIPDTILPAPWTVNAWTAARSQHAAVDALVAVLTALAAAATAMAIVNVLTVSGVRSLGRRRDDAVRSALGAGPRVFRSGKVRETAVLQGGSILIGILAASGFWYGMKATWPPGLDPVTNLAMGTAAGLLIVVLLFGVTGILRARAPRDLRGILAAGSSTADRSTGMRQSFTVVFEVALALALVSVTALLLRYGAADTGDDPDVDQDMVTVELASTVPAADALARAWDQLLDGVADLPGVEAESLASPGAWLGMGTRDRVLAECDGCVRGMMLMPLVPAYPVHHAVSRGFFETLDIAPVAGRLFDRRDQYDSARIAIVNQTFAATGFGRSGPLGKRVQVGGAGGEWFTVVGIVPDRPARGVGAPRGDVPVLYLSTQQQPPAIIGLTARSTMEPAGFAERVEAIATAEGPTIVRDAATLAETMDRAVAPLRWFGALFAVIATAALMLALHGVLVAVRARTAARRKELAVRAAVGAGPFRILAHVMAGTAKTVGAGMLFGAFASWVAGRAIQMQVGGMPPMDPATAVPLAMAMAVAALAGALGPALRAARASPARVFRE